MSARNYIAWTPPGVKWLGGIIIEIVGEAATVHHGGYYNDDGDWETAPFMVSWGIDGVNMVFQLQEWACRTMQVIEKGRYVNLLDSPISTVGGVLTIDWSFGKIGRIEEVMVHYA